MFFPPLFELMTSGSGRMTALDLVPDGAPGSGFRRRLPIVEIMISIS